MGETHVYSDFLVGTELRPIPRLSKAQTSAPETPPPLSLLRSTVGGLSSLGVSVPTRPLICGPQESWVPANPENYHQNQQRFNPEFIPKSWNIYYEIIIDPPNLIDRITRKMKCVTYDHKNFDWSFAVSSVKNLDCAVGIC